MADTPAPAGTAATTTGTPSSSAAAPPAGEGGQITPEQFLAELAAAGADTGVENDEKPADEKPAESEKKDEEPAKDDAEKAPEGEKSEDKPADEKPADPPAAAESADIKKARAIFAAAAKREAAALKREREAKAATDQNKQLTDVLRALQSGDPQALVALGFKAEDPVRDLLSKIVSHGEPAKPPTAEEQIAAIRKQLEDEKTARVEAERAATIESAKTAVSNAVRAAGEKFDLINAHEAYDAVWEAMTAYHAEHGVAPDPMVTAKFVEDELEAKLAKSKKFTRASAGAPKPATTSNGSKPTSNATGKSETLTHSDLRQPASQPGELPMDPDERFKASLKEFSLQ